MTIKEAPLIKAMNHQGPLPNFLFTNPYVCGFLPVIQCAIGAAIATLIVFSLGAAGNPVALFEIVRYGAFAGLGIAILLCLFVFLRALFLGDDPGYYSRFLTGNFVGAAAILLADFLLSPLIFDWLRTVPYLQ